MEEYRTLDVGSFLSLGGYNQSAHTVNKKVTGFDPHQLMVRRKQNMGSESNDVVVQEYDVNDVRELEEFCHNHGILGFNVGRMSPKSALQMLKNKMGIQTQPTNIKKILNG
jgi:hypothetical protein